MRFWFVSYARPCRCTSMRWQSRPDVPQQLSAFGVDVFLWFPLSAA